MIKPFFELPVFDDLVVFFKGVSLAFCPPEKLCHSHDVLVIEGVKYGSQAIVYGSVYFFYAGVIFLLFRVVLFQIVKDPFGTHGLEFVSLSFPFIF